MGLTVHAKGLTDETNFDCGYITFGVFRKELAKAYNEEMGAIYEKYMGFALIGKEVSEAECRRFDELCPPGLTIFFQCSDCDGQLTPQECRKIYDDIKDLKMDMIGHNYGVMKQYNMLERWKNMFLHCAKRRVNMYFR